MVNRDDPGRWDDDMPSGGDPGDPAEAFDALRRAVEAQGAQIGAELSVIRRGLEAAFDHLEKIEPAPDYRPEIGRIVKQLGTVGARLQAVEESPVLRQGPDHYARQMAQAGSALVRDAAQKLDGSASDFHRATTTLSGYMDSARTYDRQNIWLAGAVCFGLVFGIVLTLFLPPVLPGAVAPWVASTAMGQSQSEAGKALMRRADPAGWQNMLFGAWLYGTNHEALEACYDDMRASGKPQVCQVTMPVVK